MRGAQRLAGERAEIALPLFAVRGVDELGRGPLAIHTRPRRLPVGCDPVALHVATGTMEIDDRRLRAAWGERLQKITFSTLAEGPVGSYELRFQAEKEALGA